jgi:hypothetical protein
MKPFLILLFLSTALASEGQITPADSSVQVIGYWNKNDLETFKVEVKKYKIKGDDTLDVEIIKNQIDIKILDSTSNSYTIEWLFKNYDFTNASQLTKSLAAVPKDMKVIIKTDEMGSLTEIVNWKEIQEELKKVFLLAGQQLKDNPEAQTMLQNLQETFTSKDAIETQLLQDINHYYTFHGGKYTLNDDVENTQVSNGVPGNPVKVLTSVQLAQLNVDEDTAVIKYWKEFDPKQMTDATYAYLKNMMKSTKTQLPPRDQFPDIIYAEYVGATVHGPSGWVVFSFFQKKASSEDGMMRVEERQIEIQ